MGNSTLQITLNGDAASTEAETVSGLLRSHGLETPRVAVIVNGDIVPRAEFEQHRLHEGDAIDIITIIGGG